MNVQKSMIRLQEMCRFDSILSEKCCVFYYLFTLENRMSRFEESNGASHELGQMYSILRHIIYVCILGEFMWNVLLSFCFVSTFFLAATAVTVCRFEFSSSWPDCIAFRLAFTEHSCTLYMARQMENESPKLVESVLAFKSIQKALSLGLHLEFGFCSLVPANIV